MFYQLIGLARLIDVCKFGDYRIVDIDSHHTETTSTTSWHEISEYIENPVWWPMQNTIETISRMLVGTLSEPPVLSFCLFWLSAGWPWVGAISYVFLVKSFKRLPIEPAEKPA